MADEVPTNAAQNNGPEDSEFESLLEHFCLGDLDEKGWQRLNALISGNPAAAKRYTETAHYCQTLRDEAAGQRGVGLQAIGAIGGTTNSAVNKKSARSLAEKEGAESKQRGFSAWIAQLGIAVSLAFFCGWLASDWDKAEGKKEIASVASDAAGSVPSVQGVASVPKHVAEGVIRERDRLGRITGLTPVASSDGLLRSMSVGTRLSRGEVFQLDSGAARLELGSGCELLVEGPAELSAIDTETVFVRRGRVVVPEGCGLTVQTPIATIESEGASYVVVAESDDSMLACSLEGELTIRYMPLGEKQSLQETVKVATSETLQIVRKADHRLGLITGVPVPEDLLLSWDQTQGALHAYEQLVLEDKPLAYWPLYRVRRHRAVLDLTQNGFDGQAIGNWPDQLSDVHASQLRGAYFDGESYIESDRKPPVDLRTGFTIESWAKVDGGPEYQSVFTSRWVLASNTDQQQCFGFTLYAGADDKWQFWSGSGEYGAPWQNLIAPVAVERQCWTHVTASFDPHEEQEDSRVVSGTVRLYIDGALVTQADHKISLEDFEWPARIGAAEFVPKSLTSWLFQGELRDVALYDHVLDPMKISLHAKNGRVAI